MDDDIGRPVSRRSLLSALGVGVTAGCLQLEESTEPAATATESRAATVSPRRTDTASGTTASSPTTRSTLEPRAPGNVRWRYETPANVGERPVVADGTVYATTVGGQVLALGTDAGTPEWSYETEINSSNLRHAVAGENLFVAGANATVAVGLADGRFVRGIASGAKYKPLVRNGIAYLGAATGERTLRTFDVAADELLWSFTTSDSVRGRPALVDGTLYATAISNNGDMPAPMYAIDAESGTLQWETTIGDRLSSSVVPFDGLLYITGEGGTVAAVDPADGSVVWQRTIDGVRGAAGAPDPQFADGRLYLADRGLRALAPKTGETLWTYTEDRWFNRPAIVDGALYVTQYDGSDVLVVDPATGTSRSTFETPLEEPTGLAVGPETVVCGDRVGEIVAVWR